MLIEVKEIHPSPGERKPAKVVAMDDKTYDIWPENLTGIIAGRSYEVETKSRPWNGRTFYTITKATPVNGAAPSPPPQQQTSGQVSRGYFDEAAFTGHAIAAMILKGEIDPRNQRQATDATRMWRDIWRATSGN